MTLPHWLTTLHPMTIHTLSAKELHRAYKLHKHHEDIDELDALFVIIKYKYAKV